MKDFYDDDYDRDEDVAQRFYKQRKHKKLDDEDDEDDDLGYEESDDIWIDEEE